MIEVGVTQVPGSVMAGSDMAFECSSISGDDGGAGRPCYGSILVIGGDVHHGAANLEGNLGDREGRVGCRIDDGAGASA